MSDRLDDALRELAQVEARDGLAARVRARLEAGDVAPARWPRLAVAAAVALVIVAGTWMAVRVDRESEVRVGAALEGGTAARAGGAAVRAAGALAPPSGRPQTTPLPPPVRAGGTAVRAGGASAPLPRSPRATPLSLDHEHALPALSDIQPIVQAAVGPDALSIETALMAPLQPLVPITVPALGDEGERR